MARFPDMLAYLRKAAGLSQQELADKLGLTRSAIGMYETDKREPDLETFEMFADFFNVDMDYLHGKTSVPNRAKLEGVLPPGCLPLPKMRKWLVLGAAACGEAIHRESENEVIFAPDDIDADYIFRCVGDSMNGAHIFDGDLVFIKQGAEVPDGAIGLVRIEDEYMLKRIFRRPDCLELRSDNPAYPPRYITGEQINAEIVGRAVKFITVAI